MANNVATAAALETHTAYVFLAGDRAAKVKRPVRFDFVDFRSPEQRARACRRELSLNQRLARDVYLDVLDVVDRTGALVDSVLIMKRLPQSRQLSELVSRGVDVHDELVAVARTLASFHASPESEPQVGFDAEYSPFFDGQTGQTDNDLSGLLDPDRMAALFAVNLEQLRRVAPLEIAEDVFRVGEAAAEYARGRRPLFEHRALKGRIRDGHGDLRCESIFCLDDGPRIVDCLEFDDHLRLLDGLCDISFLATDLVYRKRATDADVLLDAYREFSGDSFPASLATYYMAYWATVRAKVACITTRQGEPGAEDPLRWMGLARQFLEDCRVAWVMVGGRPGVGKSTVAASVADVMGWSVIRSDEVRREVSEAPAFHPTGYERVSIGMAREVPDATGSGFEEGPHAPQVTEATYTTLIDRARGLTSMGESVILDATWSSERFRRMARDEARATSSRLIELACDTDVATVHERITTRAALATDVSGADVAVSDAIAGRFDPWPSAYAVDTSDDPATVTERVIWHMNSEGGRS